MSLNLPLRLASEPFVRKVLGQSCFVLPSLDEEKICFIVTDEGLLALAIDSNNYSKEDVVKITQLSIEDIPVCSVRRCHSLVDIAQSNGQSQDDGFSWLMDINRHHDFKCISKDDILSCMKPLTQETAKVIIESIER